MRHLSSLLTAVLVAVLIVGTLGGPLCPQGNDAVIQLVKGNCSALDYWSIAVLPYCGATYKVSTAKNGVFVLSPVSTSTFSYTTSSTDTTKKSFACSQATARARVPDSKKPKVAAVQWWRQSFQESVLAAKGPSTVSLKALSIPGYRNDVVNCLFEYQVTQGCLLGATPASTPAPKCDPGTIRKSGVNGIPYCEPCPSLTYSAAGAVKCTPCPAEGFRNTIPTALLPQCPSCTLTQSCTSGCDDPSQYKDAKGVCRSCPAGSSLTPTLDACAICHEGRRCCTANASPSCPACPKGTVGKELSIRLALTELVAQKGWERCKNTEIFQCYRRLDITVTPTCGIQVDVGDSSQQFYLSQVDSGPLPAQPGWPPTNRLVSCQLVNGGGVLPDLMNVANNGKFELARDVVSKVFHREDNRIKAVVAKVSGPYIDLKYNGSSCRPRFRLLATSNPALLPMKPSGACSKRALECRNPCPAGNYVATAAGGLKACLPCPQGTFTAKGGQTSCTTCKPGYAAFGMGNTACKRCPGGSFSAKAGAGRCDSCALVANGWSGSGASSCTTCKSGTSIGGGCIHVGGDRPCCLEGNCPGLSKCPPTPPAPYALLSLLSTLDKKGTCSRIPLISCLKGGTLVYGVSHDPAKMAPKGAFFNALVPPGTRGECGLVGKQGFTAEKYLGANSLYIRIFDTSDGPFTNSAWLGQITMAPKTGLVTIMLYKEDSATVVTSARPPPCKVLLKLQSGILLGVKKHATSCPSGTQLVNVAGTKSCMACGPGQRLQGGKCAACPLGTFSTAFNSTTCTACPSGTYSAYFSAGASGCDRCAAGLYPVASQKTCQPCPVNTFAQPGFVACKTCPSGTSTKGQQAAPFCYF